LRKSSQAQPNVGACGWKSGLFEPDPRTNCLAMALLNGTHSTGMVE
jgi:hypothetical protein